MSVWLCLTRGVYLIRCSDVTSLFSMKKDNQPQTESIVPIEHVERKIYLIRGQKVILDVDLATLYQVATRVLIQTIKRNRERFPEDFMFQLTDGEAESLRSQIVISKPIGRGGRRYLPYAFTEHGVAMLSSVLKSARAVQMNILIVRAFIQLRNMLATHRDLAERIERLEAMQQHHADVINLLAEEIGQMKELPPEAPKHPIGFKPPEDE